MNETSANLLERVLPPRTGLRQWVLTFPFPWRRRLSQDGALLGRLTRILVETVMAFYIERAEKDVQGAKTGAAVSGQAPPAGPQWLSGLAPLMPHPLAYDKPLCASLDGFTLHAATRAGADDPVGREALLRYVLRPPLAQERLEQRQGGLVRISLKKAYADGTMAVNMDPLSLLCRLAASVPPPRFHTVRYAGVLAPASPWRSRLAPQACADAPPTSPEPASRESRVQERTGPTVRGQSFSEGRSPWTFSNVPGVRGA